MTAKIDVQLVVAQEEHAGAVAEFYREVWDEHSTADLVLKSRAASAASNPAEPGSPAPVFLALLAHRVVGHLASIPARFWNGSAQLPGYWLKGFMVLPEYRGGPIGFAVLREATRHLPRSAALTVAPASRRLFGALGYRDVGCVPNFVRVLRGGRVASRLNLAALGIETGPSALRSLVPVAQRIGLAWAGGHLLGGALRLRAALGRVGGGFDDGSRGMPGSAELDALWMSGRGAVQASAVRDAVELDLRYGTAAGDEAAPYRIATVRRRGVLAGVAVVREPRSEGDPRLAGIALASLSDLWFDPADRAAGLATLGAAEALGRELGADALLCSTAHGTVSALLRQQGYLRAGGNMHLMFRDVTGAASSWPVALDSWWVSRGDGRSDDVF